MAFTDVTWTNGDTITETKMDNMVNNDAHLRAEVDNRAVLDVPYHEAAGAVGSAVRLIWKLDSTDLAAPSGVSGASYNAWTSHNVAASVSEAVHTLTVTLQHNVSGTWTTLAEFAVRFYKSADLDYLSLWADLKLDQSNDIAYVRGLTVIGHRESTTW